MFTVRQGSQTTVNTTLWYWNFLRKEWCKHRSCLFILTTWKSPRVENSTQLWLRNKRKFWTERTCTLVRTLVETSVYLSYVRESKPRSVRDTKSQVSWVLLPSKKNQYGHWKTSYLHLYTMKSFESKRKTSKSTKECKVFVGPYECMWQIYVPTCVFSVHVDTHTLSVDRPKFQYKRKTTSNFTTMVIWYNLRLQHGKFITLIQKEQDGIYQSLGENIITSKTS